MIMMMMMMMMMKEIFPNVELKGCFFHLSQNIAALGLTARSFSCLPFFRSSKKEREKEKKRAITVVLWSDESAYGPDFIIGTK